MSYLKGLDTLRAIAALIVVWGHLELLKQRQGLENLLSNDRINLPSAHLAVILFFVISGFLITYLLVGEKDKNGGISFRKFYIRRILRILPLYYLILLLSFLLFRTEYEYPKQTVLLCISIFPNIAHALNIEWASSPQIWSIGVEEQFYLFWPLVLMLIPDRRIPLALIIFFIGYSLLPHFIAFVNIRTLQSQDITNISHKFFLGSKFNCIAIGALLGFLYAKRNKYLDYIGNNFVAWSSIVLSVILWMSGFRLAHFTDEFFSVLFAVALYNIVNNPKIDIDTGVFSFIGKISYGIYMYHWIVILLALKYLPLSENQWLYNIVLYPVVFGGTIIVSWISYIGFEKYFLDLKQRFRVNV